jgi:menaquinone-dependent protoporphyrinogen oxidase
MPDSILVGYATRTGSTREIAETIAARLRDLRREADVRPAKEVRSLEGYGSVVLGAPLFMFHWHKEAMGFLTRHRDALAQRPMAIFALGPFHNVEKEWQEVRGQFAGELAKFPWLTPVAQEVFGGKFDPSQLRFPMTLIPALKKMPASDVRDWNAIRDWAVKLAALL